MGENGGGGEDGWERMQGWERVQGLERAGVGRAGIGETCEAQDGMLIQRLKRP